MGFCLLSQRRDVFLRALQAFVGFGLGPADDLLRLGGRSSDDLLGIGVRLGDGGVGGPVRVGQHGFGFGAHTVGLRARVDEELGGLGFGASGRLVPLGTRRRRDLLRGLPGRRKEALDLFAGLVQRMPHRSLRGGTDLELRDDAVDALNVRIDGPPVVPADGDREGDVEDLARHVVPQPHGARRSGLVRRTGFILWHDPEYAAWRRPPYCSRDEDSPVPGAARVGATQDRAHTPRLLLPSFALLGALVALAVPTAAFAHANLIRVTPADGSAVKTAPASIRLLFDDVIRTEPGIRAVDNAGSSVLGGSPRVAGGRTLVIPLRAGLRRGGYTVLWRVLSDDGHQVAGVTTFAVGVGQPPPRPVLAKPSESRVVPGFERWLFLGGILLAVGLSLFRIAMPRDAAPSLRLLVLGFALAAGGGAALVARTSLSTRFGLVIAIAVCVAVVGAGVSLAARFVRRLAAGAWACGLALVAAPSASGHALDPGRSRIELPIDVLHVAASSVWFGGVVALAFAARHGEFRERALRRFSALALLSIGVIGVTGVVRAVSELSSIAQITETGYGRLLLVKTGLFAVLVVLGWTNRYRLVPTLAKSAQQLRRNLRAEALLFVGLIAAVAFLTQTRPGRDQALAAPPAAARVQPPATPEEAVVLAQAAQGFELAGQAANSVSVDGRSVLWETVPEEGGSSVLVERNLDDQRTRVLARNVAPLYGLAATAQSIVYANGAAPAHLVALDRRTGRRTVLSDALAAPFAWRGDRVAWAEERGGRQRVVVYDLRRRKPSTAADLPVCMGQLCYRVDGVTLADRGVVFTRGAVGPQPSFVVRREFGASRPTSVKIEHDPQPDLVPSATGAVYYALNHGWYRWNFGAKRPLRIPELAQPSLYPIAYDGRKWFLLRHRGCDDSVVERSGSGGTATVASPARALSIAGVRTKVCVRFANLTWAEKHPVTTWIVLPRATHPEGATGVVVLGGPARS